MDDLISRQAAIDALRKMQTYKLFSGDDMLLIDQAGAQTELMMLPPAQPEPLQPWEVLAAQVVLSQPDIIRCKDCKHRWTHKCMDSMPIERCDLGQTFYDAEVDYCSLAERREVTT